MSSGVLLLDKPLGLSSNGATQRVRRLLRADKAGHVGSLDPLATGMLPICLGEATKLAGEVLDGAKVYHFRIALGARTATGDVEGEVVETASVPPLDATRVADVLGGFLGESQQVPPMYSALKRDGRPLYELARAGITVERAPRPIVIHALELLALGADFLDCRVRCGKGTYVRTLAEDIARALGTCGHVATLRREAVAPFEAGQMVTLEALEGLVAQGRQPRLVAPDQAVAHLPAATFDAEATRRLGLGQAVDLPASAGGAALGGPGSLLRLYGPGPAFLGLGRLEPGARVQPKRLFVEPWMAGRSGDEGGVVG